MNYRFARDGHLLDLDADALITGDLGFSQRADVEAHVSGCLLCRRRVAEAREVYAAAPPPLRSLDHARGSTRGLTAPSGAAVPMAKANAKEKAKAPLQPTPPQPAPPQPAPPQPAPPQAASPSAPRTTGPTQAHEVRRPAAKRPAPTSAPPQPAPAPPAIQPPPAASSASAIRSATAAAAAEVGAAAAGQGAPSAKSGRARWYLPAVAVVVAILTVKFFQAPPPEKATGAPTEGVVLEVHRLTDEGKKERLLDGTTGRPGDILGFKIRLAKPAHALLIAIPPQGPPFAIWPPGIAAGTPIPLSSGAQTIEASVELPEGSGPSRLVVFGCPIPLTAGQLLTSATLAIPGAVPQFVPECAQSVVTLRQIAAPL